MAFGVTTGGFVIKRLPDIVASLVTRLQAKFGLLGMTINVQPDSVFGQLIAALAPEFSDVWQSLEASYLSMYPDSAEGYQLYQVGSINGLEPLPATQSIVEGVIWAEVGTDIHADEFYISVEETDEQFLLIEQVIIQDVNLAACRISVQEVLTDPDAYEITINGSLTSILGPGGTVEQCAEFISDTMNATGDIIASFEGQYVTFKPVDSASTFTIAVGPVGDLIIEEIANFGTFEAVNAGVVIALTGTLTQIETPVVGVTAVENLVDATVGEAAETEQEFRARRLISLALAGAGTDAAIRAHILEIPEVTGCSVTSNRGYTGPVTNCLIRVLFNGVATAYNWRIDADDQTYAETDPGATTAEIATAIAVVINGTVGCPVVAEAVDDVVYLTLATGETTATVFTYTTPIGILCGLRLETTLGLDSAAHSFHVVVQAVDTPAVNQAIGDIIWLYQASGIPSTGAVEVTVVDVEGNEQTVYFDRPTATPVYIRVTLTENTEETFPTGGEAAIAAAILEAGNALQVGEDVVLGKFNLQIFAVPGVATAVIEQSVNGTDYFTTNLAIDSTHLATFDSARISVSGIET
jgi:uncharacterized phage protein gp47/JayE